MTREAIYDRLRAIGVDFENADFLAGNMANMSDRKIEAFFLCCQGNNNCVVAQRTGCTEGTIRNLLKKLRIGMF